MYNIINQRIINNKNNHPAYATKGWIIDKISSYNNNTILYFIDDLNNNNIKTIFINKNIIKRIYRVFYFLSHYYIIQLLYKILLKKI